MERKTDKGLMNFQIHPAKSRLDKIITAWSPSGKAAVCKTSIREFDSRPGLKIFVKISVVFDSLLMPGWWNW